MIFQAIYNRICELGDEARERYDIEHDAYGAADWMHAIICEEYPDLTPEERDSIYEEIIGGLT